MTESGDEVEKEEKARTKKREPAAVVTFKRDQGVAEPARASPKRTSPTNSQNRKTPHVQVSVTQLAGTVGPQVSQR